MRKEKKEKKEGGKKTEAAIALLKTCIKERKEKKRKEKKRKEEKRG